MKNLFILNISLILLTACSYGYDGSLNLPLLYRINIQQGNVIDQKMLAKLKSGMNKNQVEFILGTPVLIDPFRNDRWDYIYSFQKGNNVRKQRHVSLHFRENKLSHLSGDIKISNTLVSQTNIITEKNAVVMPDSTKKKEEKGFFSRIWKMISSED